MATERVPRIRLRGVREESVFVIRGVEIVATFRRPHVTLCHERLDALVAGLLRCEHRVLENPYNVPDDGM